MNEDRIGHKIHFEALTGFRFLAAVLVFIYHNRKYWRAHLHPEVLRLINEFHIGVEIFFVLSGFLIAYTYNTQPLLNAKSYFRYFLTRVARIFPIYWIILVCYFFDFKNGNFTDSWRTFSLVHGFSSDFNLDAIAQAWSLTVEMTFYILAPCLFYILKKSRLLLLTAVFLLFGIALGTGCVWKVVNGNPNNWFANAEFLANSTFFGRSFAFCTGMLLAWMMQTKNTLVLDSIKNKTTIGFLGIFVVAYFSGFFQPNIFGHGVDHPIGWILQRIFIPIYVVVFLYGLITEKTRLFAFFSSPLIVLLGNASFVFYLIHISYVNIRLRMFYLMWDRNFVILWLISILVYLMIEKPVYQFLRKQIAKI